MSASIVYSFHVSNQSFFKWQGVIKYQMKFDKLNLGRS